MKERNRSSKKERRSREVYSSFSFQLMNVQSQSPADRDQSGGCTRRARVSAEPDVILRADSFIITYQVPLQRAAASLSQT